MVFASFLVDGFWLRGFRLIPANEVSTGICPQAMGLASPHQPPNCHSGLIEGRTIKCTGSGFLDK